MRHVILAVFALTYVAISARRLHVLPIGRPAAALVGACALVALGPFAGAHGLSPDRALAAVEPNTLALLTGMMLLAAALDVAGFFEVAVAALRRWTTRPVPSLYAVTVGAGLLSAVLVNDAVCLLATPFVLRVARRMGAPATPYLLGLAMGANAGSALTLAGNPQNMLVARLSGLTYRGYFLHVLPAGLAALGITAALVHLLHRSMLAAVAPAGDAPEPVPPAAHPRLLRVALAALAAVVAANLAGASLAFSALTGGAAALVAAGEGAPALFRRVEWTVLVFFAALFVVVAALRRTGLPDEALAAATRVVPTRGLGGVGLLTAVLSLGSQVVSNVPLILVLQPWVETFPDRDLAWTLTAVVSTLAGNLTLLGSVANVIVLEQAGAEGHVGFWGYLRVGVPVTLASTAVAVALVVLLR